MVNKKRVSLETEGKTEGERESDRERDRERERKREREREREGGIRLPFYLFFLTVCCPFLLYLFLFL